MNAGLDIGIIIHDKKNRILHANSASHRILGLTSDEIYNFDFKNPPFHLYSENGKLKEFNLTNNQVKDIVLNLRYLKKKCTKCISITSIPIILENNQKINIITFYDIPNNAETSSILNKNKDFLQLILDNIPQHIFWKDKNLIYRGCNTNFAKAAGVGEPENIVGKTDYDLAWKDEEMESFRNDDLSVITKRKPLLNIVEPQLQADGKEAWLETNKIPLINKDNEVTGILGTFHDITELLKAKQKVEDMLKTENERLELLINERTKELEATLQELMNKEKLASLGSLVAGVAHEINTPLGVAVTASTYLEDLNREAYNSLSSNKLSKNSLIKYMKDVDETTKIINKNLYNSAELIKSFKEISVKHNLEMTTKFNLTHYIDSLILTLKHEYKNTPHIIELKTKKQVWIKSYPSDFSQILTNLIMNSLIHGFTNNVPGIITIDIDKNQDSLFILFKDSGKGIKPENIIKIFDPFFTTNRQKGGSGLGLNIVYNLVTEKLKGNIKCDSTLNKGTLFKITIPLGET